MDRQVAMALGRLAEQMNELGRRIDHLSTIRNDDRKSETTENENGIFDVAYLADENNNGIFELAEMISELEARLEVIENGQ